MQITKWYLDCVTDDGRGIIVYALRLTAGVATLHAQSLLRFGAGRSQRLVRRGWPTTLADSATAIQLAAPALALDARWQKDDVPLPPPQPWLGRDGGVRWACRALGADVSVDLDGERLHGRGYAEVLELAAAPWDLPLRTLRWGRFVPDRADTQAHAVWLRWDGPPDLRWLHCGNAGAPAPALAADSWQAGPLILRQSPVRDLRRGPLLGPRAAALAGALPRAPRWLARLHEHKWLARATLQSPLGTATGWVIDERVGFDGNG